jgi:dynein heavy chain, axonemal
MHQRKSCRTKAVLKIGVQGEDADLVRNAINRVFVYACIWGVGGNLQQSCHAAFDTFIREQMSKLVALPPAGTVFDCFVDTSLFPIELRHWKDFIPSFQYSKSKPFFSMLVPTLDTCRC